MKLQFKNIAKLIESKRIEAKLTQKQLSTLLGYPNAQTISNIERGYCNLPLKTALQVCSILKIDVDLMADTLKADWEAKLNNILNNEVEL
jgi:DNA-binding XRE family transcriptional regulator